MNDPAVLWPDVSEPAVARALRAIEQASAPLLHGDGPAPVELALPPTVPDAAFGVAAFLSGMGPLLGYWHESGRLIPPDRVAPMLAAHIDHSRRRAARLRAETERVLSVCATRGIEVGVLKGAHTAYAYFPDPGTRPMADVDLLVAPDDHTAARRILIELGFVEANTHALPHRSDWVRPDTQTVRSLEWHHEDNPWAIELHVSLDRVYTPRVTARFGPLALAQAPTREDYAVPAHVLEQPLLLAYVACHASSHFASLSLLRLTEIVLIARRDYAVPAAWEAFDALLEQTNTVQFAFPALALAEGFVGGTVPPALLERSAARAPRAVRRRVARTTPATAQHFGPTRPDYAPMWARTLGERAAYLVHLVWPHRGGTPVGVRDALAWQGGRLQRLVRTWRRQVASALRR